ncbi:MAG: hypothetical protein KGD60_14810 [Candidatus Thorarchaeota archaeon]|nr:hypothetical protein [Candidatus Thorarchaeota archaeon]
MKQKLIALLLVIHGLISSIFMFYIENPPEPGVGWNGTSWLLTGVLDGAVVQVLGTILWGLTVLLFVIAGIALFMKREQWRLIDILAALVSLLAYVLFWNGLEPVPEYWIVGPVISVVTLVALIVVRWPQDEWIFGTEAAA